jgi:anaerobic magnesium-protoporphyrin IX monomethyl ester cyclase
MKVLLINAPSIYAAVTTSDWDTTAEDIGAFPPIGISYVAGYLATHSNHDIKILDSLAERLDYSQIEERIKSYQPDIVGVTAFTPTFYDVLQVARIVKTVVPDCFVCLGGSHVVTYPEETMHHPEIDFLVHGEGEIIFTNLLDALQNRSDVANIDGISFRADGRVVHNNETKGYIQDINTLPSPAFDLMPLDKYKSAIGTGNTVGTIATSRGCPYDCTYCNRPYRSYRSYSNDRILSEIGYFHSRGVKEFVFFDDMFNLNPRRVMEISDAILSQFPDILWSFRGRVDQVTEEMVRKAKKSGCRQILFGVEAARDEDLKAIKKKITTKQVIDAISICKKMGIETSTNWLIGLPTHRNKDDVMDLLDFAIKSGSDYAQFNILIPYAGTELFADGVRKNVLPPDFWNEYILNPAPNAYIPIWEEHMSREELSRLLKVCYRKFYLRPAAIIKNVFNVRSFAQFKAKFKGMLTVMGFGGYKREKEKS